MIQAARHLAVFWPIQGADVIPTDKKQRPQRGLAGVLYARLTAQALGGRGARKRPAFVDFEPGRFRNLYQIAHSERRWKSGTTPHVGDQTTQMRHISQTRIVPQFDSRQNWSDCLLRLAQLAQ
jgi:hypothetical protein